MTETQVETQVETTVAVEATPAVRTHLVEAIREIASRPRYVKAGWSVVGAAEDSEIDSMIGARVRSTRTAARQVLRTLVIPSRQGQLSAS